MNILLSLLIYLGAGLINGSFATPTKYIKKWNFENIWFQYSLWVFIVLPWIAIFFLAPQVIDVYRTAPFNLMVVIILGGLLFGIGQIASALAIHMIGIGLAFVICIGISTGLGFFLPLLIKYPDKIMTPFGYMTMLGTFLAILGFVFSTYAGKLKNKQRFSMVKDKKINHRIYYMGVFLALMAGIFSAGQNFCFALTNDLQKLALDMGATKLGAAMIIWPIFLTLAFIPYLSYMIYLFYRNRSFSYYKTANISKYYLLTFIMGLFWYSSLMLYSKASQMGGALGPIFGWPIFMVLIILTSSFWGWIHKEWEKASRLSLFYLFIGLALLIFSMLILGISSYLNFDYYV